jgi:hypothetical protein
MHLSRKGDYMFSFDLQDGLYAVGINPTDRDYFTVNVRGQLHRLARLPMMWSLFPLYFCKLILTFVIFLRAPYLELPCPSRGNGTKTYSQTNALAWREDSSLRRRLSTICGYG